MISPGAGRAVGGGASSDRARRRGAGARDWADAGLEARKCREDDGAAGWRSGLVLGRLAMWMDAPGPRALHRATARWCRGRGALEEGSFCGTQRGLLPRARASPSREVAAEAREGGASSAGAGLGHPDVSALERGPGHLKHCVLHCRPAGRIRGQKRRLGAWKAWTVVCRNFWGHPRRVPARKASTKYVHNSHYHQ